MGQQQTKQPIHVLIKDIEYFNKVIKSMPLQQELNKQIGAELIQNKQTFQEQLLSFTAKTDLAIILKIDERQKLIDQETFYKLKQLIQDLAYLYMKNNDDEVCQICFEKKIDKLLPCGHSYCQNCIDGWFSVKLRDSCPMCRTRFTKQKMLQNSYCFPDEKDFIDSFKEEVLKLLN
ncbi:unnamed protein product [Paramecium primaurelia]|uniref:RING-type domain-containing protein n=2 Tax=Paramecium TaxID=5884 RepID=A0A8S1U0M9_9CILI|nr:unnamed protein product [Paramecium primaurelia]CAD8158078.1 unnamed protein product [Paramecium pentaurelia]